MLVTRRITSNFPHSDSPDRHRISPHVRHSQGLPQGNTNITPNDPFNKLHLNPIHSKLTAPTRWMELHHTRSPSPKVVHSGIVRLGGELYKCENESGNQVSHTWLPLVESRCKSFRKSVYQFVRGIDLLSLGSIYTLPSPSQHLFYFLINKFLETYSQDLFVSFSGSNSNLRSSAISLNAFFQYSVLLKSWTICNRFIISSCSPVTYPNL